MLQKQLNVLKKALYVFSIIVFIIIRSLLILILYKIVPIQQSMKSETMYMANSRSHLSNLSLRIFIFIKINVLY